MYLYFFCIYYAFYGIYVFNFLIRAQNCYGTETKKQKKIFKHHFLKEFESINFNVFLLIRYGIEKKKK